MKKVVFADIAGFEPLAEDPLADIARAEYYYDAPSDDVFLDRCRDTELMVWGWVNISNEMLDQLSKLEMVVYMGIGPREPAGHEERPLQGNNDLQHAPTTATWRWPSTASR